MIVIASNVSCFSLEDVVMAEPVFPFWIQANLIGKRQVLYTVALAAPVPLLTSAAALHLFPDGWAVVAGAGVFVWILASGGMCSLSMHTELFWKIRRRGGDHQQDRLNVSRQ